MSDRGKFSGFNWHFEFHTTNPKKEKAADCIYLTTDRICQNNKSLNYLTKCFVATDCPLRIKEKDAEIAAKKESEPAHTPKKQLPIKKIKCTLPMGCKIYSNKFGQGKYVDYNENSMIISVQFEDEKIVRFLYPNAVLDKHLIVPKFAFKSVLYDIRHAERG